MFCSARRRACLRYNNMSSFCIAVAVAYCNTLIISVHVKSLQVVSQPEAIVSQDCIVSWLLNCIVEECLHV